MSEQWFREYILLAHRIDKTFRQTTNSPFVDFYYGPPAWKALVEADPGISAGELLRAAILLHETLPAQGFVPQRVSYLSKQVRAMETICRKLHGEVFSLEEEVERCLDICPTWIPESQFEEALALYDEILPGKGTLSRRLHDWRSQQRFPWHKPGLLVRLVQTAVAEARRRTQSFVKLPEDEGVEIETVIEEPYGGACLYQGDYRSRIQVNADVLTSLNGLLEFVCHESYPGHHAECVLKEQHLYRQHGYLEHAIGLTISPQSVISEGVAMHACDIIFPHDEQTQWLTEHIYPEFGIELDRIDVVKLNRAVDLLEGVNCNAAIMLREGRSDDEVMDYTTKYLQGANLDFLKVPLHEIYVFTYYYGKQLMHPWLQGTDRQAVFRRFLMEAMNPSDLVKEHTV